jgi:hypothetical protein
MSKSNAVTTIYDQYATLASKYKLPFTPEAGTTLNDKFGINYAAPPTEGYPEIKYLAVGNGGHAVITGDNFVCGLMHSCTDSALKNQLPWIVVPANNDLTLVEMAKYRIRVPMVIRGNPYIAYYLKVIDFPPMHIGYSTFKLEGGEVVNQQVYVPTLATQNPNMIDSSNISLNLVSGNHIATTIDTSIHLSEADLNGIIDACILLYGTANAATISELALVHGFDIESQLLVNGVQATYTEVQCAQVANFISIVYPANANPNPSITEGINIGIAQPLLMSI